MFKTVCPPIKLIKGVQDGLLATLLWRTLVKSPEAGDGLPVSFSSLLLSAAPVSEFQLPEWLQTLRHASPAARKGGERHLPLSRVTCYSPWWLALSEGPKQKLLEGCASVCARRACSPVLTGVSGALLCAWCTAGYSARGAGEETSVSPFREPPFKDGDRPRERELYTIWQVSRKEKPGLIVINI